MQLNRSFSLILLGLALGSGLGAAEPVSAATPVPAAALPRKTEADAAWAGVLGARAGDRDRDEQIKKRGIHSPEFLKWAAEKGRQFRDKGREFWRRFPDDPRRFLWFYMVAINRENFWWKDLEQGARAEAAGTPELAVIDKEALAAWGRDYVLMRAEYLASPEVRDTGPVAPARQALRSHELWQRIVAAWRASQFGRKSDLGPLMLDYLDAASQPLTGPTAGPNEYWITAMANSLLECMDKDPDTEAAFIAAMKLSPRVDVQLFAAGRDQVMRLRGKPVNLHFTAMDGTPVDLERLRGKVVLVDIWGVYCTGCIEAMPGLEQTYQRYRDQGFEIVSLCLIDNEAKERPEAFRLLKENGVTYTACELIGKAKTDEFMKTYGVIGFPVTWLLDQQGMLVTTEIHGPRLEHEVRRLLGLSPLAAGKTAAASEAGAKEPIPAKPGN